MTSGGKGVEFGVGGGVTIDLSMFEGAIGETAATHLELEVDRDCVTWTAGTFVPVLVKG